MGFFGGKWPWALPAIHLAACMAIWLARIESGVHYLIYADFPVSLPIVMLGGGMIVFSYFSRLLEPHGGAD